MAPTVERKLYHHTYINGVMGSFFRGMADFFRTEFFPRTTEVVMATYEKAVVHYHNRIKNLGEQHSPQYPFVTFDPSLDFEPDPQGGRFLHGYPQFETTIGRDLNRNKIYEDDNISISPVLNRYKGRFELIIWASSVYEAIDYRVLSYQFFGGLDRYLRPANIEGYFVLPEELVLYNYDNLYTGENYDLDWANKTTAGNKLIKNINQTKLCWPFSIHPMVKLTGITDGSEKYGGDDLSESRLTLEMEWEAAIPTHLIFDVQKLPARAKNIVFQITSGFNYVPASDDLAPDELMLSIMDSTSGEVTRVDANYEDAYNYVLTEDDANGLEDGDDIVIDIGSSVDMSELIKVYGRFGILKESYNFELEDGHNVVLIGDSIEGLITGDIITIVKYKEIVG